MFFNKLFNSRKLLTHDLGYVVLNLDLLFSYARSKQQNNTTTKPY